MSHYFLPLIALTLLACSPDPHHLAVVFPEAGGLKPGDNVTIRGLAVGQVTDVDLHPDGVVARLEIAPRFRTHLDAGAAFRIESERLVTGKMAVVVTPGDPPGAPLADGATVTGQGPPAGPIDAAKQALTETVDHAAAQGRGLGRALLDPDQLPPRAAGGTVDLDRPGEFRLRLLGVRVEATTADGAGWDSTSAPDLVVQVWVDERQVLLTPTAEDTLAVEFQDAASAPFALTGREAVRVKVLDADVSFNDEIGIVELRPTAQDARAGRRFRLAAGRVAELVLVVEEVPPPAPQGDAGVPAE
ncbi:MAG: MCE family protein [Myxococcales bacterium]|nr:MCE family protein [Myxococcales bacterium]